MTLALILNIAFGAGLLAFLALAMRLPFRLRDASAPTETAERHAAATRSIWQRSRRPSPARPAYRGAQVRGYSEAAQEG